MIDELKPLQPLGQELRRKADNAGVEMIWRAQARHAAQALVRNGKVESATASSSTGHGVQLFTEEGHTVLGSRDDFVPDKAVALMDHLVHAVKQAGPLGLEPTPASGLTMVKAQALPDVLSDFDKIDLPAAGKRLIELEKEIRAHVPGAGVKFSYRTDLDCWRIMRSDGTDVLFAMPRCGLSMTASSDGDSGRNTVGVSLHHPSPACAWEEPFVTRFMRRARDAARLALALPDAPNHEAGSFPVVIDYALAKGLAHEAFGHAAEADGYRSSVLAKDGRFDRGRKVGPDHVSIIDEPVAGDHAWQPYSANGVKRRRTVIVENGILADGLSDPWSARPGGVPLSGAGRAESFRSAPIPRMTNIRLELDNPIDAGGEFEDYGPEEVRALLSEAGVFRRHKTVSFLSGYRGGQVNTVSGDFVFNCKAIYKLSDSGVEFFKPAIFSGSMFGALESIREGFGPLTLDALGYCGKWGQSVPSSGGSHWFLVLDDHPDVHLGGS
jgi:TldD protein